MAGEAVDSHEFVPAECLSQVVDQAGEFRKRGLLKIDAAVRSFLKGIEDVGVEDGGADFRPKLDRSIESFLIFLRSRFLERPDPSHRVGGVISLACVALSLEGHLRGFEERFVEVALGLFYDQDVRVRYYSCESLYNIVKKCRGCVLPSFAPIFDGLCKDVRFAAQILNRLLCDVVLELESPPLDQIVSVLSSRISTQNTQIQHLIISWVMTINSVPRVDMIEYLPKVFMGLGDMLIGNNLDVRNSAQSCLESFRSTFRARFSEGRLMSEDFFRVLLLSSKRPEAEIRLLTLRWTRDVCEIQPQVVHFRGFALLLDFILSSLSEDSDEVNSIAFEANQLLSSNVRGAGSIGFIETVTEVLSERLLEDKDERVVLSILEWYTVMMEISPEKMKAQSLLLSKSVVACFRQSSSNMVVEATLRVIVLLIALGEAQLQHLSSDLLALFRSDPKLLEDSGREIILSLCGRVGFRRFYTIITEAIQSCKDREFLDKMVHSLNWTLLTSKEAEELRRELLLEDQLHLRNQLHHTWKLNLASALAFALWTEEYDRAQEIVTHLGLERLDLDLLVNLDQVVQLLDTRIFIRMRMHLLRPDLYPKLLSSLLGLSMILPQNETNRQLMRRLRTSQLVLLSQINQTTTTTN